MKKHAFKAICVTLTAAMAATAFAGCSGGDTTSSSQAGSSQASSAASSAGSSSAASAAGDSGAKEQITLTILKGKASHEVPYDQMMVIQEMSKKFNIEFKWDQPSSDNFQERFNLVMVSNELPDIIMDMPMTEVMKYASAGSIIPLTDYVNNQMPNLKAQLDARPSAQKNITYPDGNIYYLPMIDEKTSGNNPYGVRTDWLEKLGLERPKTIEDWENMWKMMKETDLNGNGQNDEIPFSAGSIDSLRNFCTAWGVVDAVNGGGNPDGFYNDPTDNKIHYGPIEDGYRQAVEWLADMFAKGYIDPEIVTINGDIFQSKMAQNQVGSFRGPLGGNFASFNSTMPKNIEGFHVAAVQPPAGPEGKYIHSAIDQTPRGTAAATITKDCKNIDRALEWLDWLYGEEGSLFFSVGVEGDTYEIVDGNPRLSDRIMNDADRSPKQMVGTFTPAQSTFPFLFSQWNSASIDDASVLEAKKEYIIPFLEESNKYILPGTLSFSEAESEEVAAIKTDVETYYRENVLAFITGKKPLAEWDAYVQNIKDMNIDRAIEIYQAAMDAWNAK